MNNLSVSHAFNKDIPQTIIWQENTLKILDQRKLPQQVIYISAVDIKQVWHAIKTLSVRGAPAIGICAAYGLALSMRDIPAQAFADTAKQNAEYLKSARPTAVNLSWAVDQVITGTSYARNGGHCAEHS